MYGIVPAAGFGSRMASHCVSGSKLLLELSDGETLLSKTFRSLQESCVFDGVVVAVREEEEGKVAELARESMPSLQVETVVGGNSRQESVFNAISQLEERARTVAVHDAARPFCTPELIRAVVKRGRETGAAVLAIPAKDTLKRSDGDMGIVETIHRACVWLAQTPQVFDFRVLRDAHLNALRENYRGTDDSELVERLGHEVSIVMGSELNIKITRPEDLLIAEAVLGSRSGADRK